LTETRGRVEELAPSATSVFGVVDANRLEAFAGGDVGFIRS
jgi:hypothetical protein